MKRILFLGLLIFRLFEMRPCECARTITEFTAQDYNEYEIIFEGTLDTIYDRGSYKLLPFKVSKYFKGGKNKTIDVILYGTTCDPIFETGKKYRVFGDKGPGPLYNVSKCGHTHEIGVDLEKYLRYNEFPDSVWMHYNDSRQRMTKSQFLLMHRKLLLQQDSILDYLSNLDSGVVVTHFFNGQLSATGHFQNGKPMGRWEYFYPDGSLYKMVSYLYGIKNGIYEEHSKKSWDYKVTKGIYLGGERCGQWTFISQSGKRKKVTYDKRCINFK